MLRSGARVVCFAVLVSLIALALGTAGPPTVSAASPADGSGGKAVAHRANGRRVSARNAPDAKLYRIPDTEAIEPTLGINKKGHIFYTAASGATNVDVFKSTDSGKTWTLASPTFPGGVKAHPVTLDPYVYVAEPTGRIFNIDLTVACSYLSFSDDGGTTWITNPIACGRPINDHQTLFSGPPAISPTGVYEEIVYYCWNDFGFGSSCSKSLDGGISWTPTGSPAFLGYDLEGQGDQCGGFHGHGVVGKDGTVYLPKEYCGQPFLGISKDEGLTWEPVQVASNTTERLGSDTSVAVDRKGNLYYAYETQNQELYLVTSRDGGKTWSKPMMVAHPAVEEVTLPTLDVGDPGKVAIGYVATEDSPFDKCEPDCTSAHYAKTEWNGYITITSDVFANDPLFFSSTANDPDDPIYRGRCDFTTRCGPLLDFMDIEISPDGTAYAAMVDACTLVCVKTGPASGSDAIVGRLVGGPKLR
ncbi:MAG TPA: sialidase family protein [Actinomycetota bacterium]|nr:sialidase family protein [Actinomycetota bacterium]